MNIAIVLKYRFFLFFLISFCLLFSAVPTLLAGPNEGINSQISLNLLFEWQNYKEHEKDTGIDTKANHNTWVIRAEGIKRWTHLFCGINAALPVLLDFEKEEVTRYDRPYQTNSLESKWIRVEGFLGYPFRPWANPYVGLRWSDLRQERKNFTGAGSGSLSLSVEEVVSWNLLVGIRGVGNISPKVRWNYGVQYFQPLKIDVTNSSFPGFKATETDGYMFELRGGLDYLFTRSFTVGFVLYVGQVHWNGSGWKVIGPSRIKWPENELLYMGGGLKIAYYF